MPVVLQEPPMRHRGVISRTSASFLPCRFASRTVYSLAWCSNGHSLHTEGPLKRHVPMLHASGCFGVKMSDKLLTFSRHKNKT